MKCFVFIFVLLHTLVYGQKRVAYKTVLKSVTTYTYQPVFKWEGYTRTGICVFGVAKTEREAIRRAEKFTCKNWNTPYKLIYYYIQKDLGKEVNYFENFQRRCPDGYKILSTREQAALQIAKHKGIPKAAIYFSETSKLDYSQTLKHLRYLSDTLGVYRVSGL